MERTVTDPMIGRLLEGRYRVEARIARGGMAYVYEATDLRLDRVCALKVMHAGLGDDDDFARRFVREARTAARLSHPNVVGVFDQGDDDGTLFLVMELVEGQTLREVIRRDAPMGPRAALALVDPILAGLVAAHHARMIHRDVKPENVLLARDGRVKVADFGLARAVSAETQHTATGGVLIGTVSYLSPELVVDGRADARSDVYAVGVMLFEMLTGHKPHEGESPLQVAYKHVHEDVPAPSREIAGLPAYVDALVARATSRDRDLRPADARVLLHQVRRVRAALDQGVTEDPDLVADLSPGGPAPREAGIDYVRDEPQEPADVRTILSPQQAARVGTADAATGPAPDTSIISTRPQANAGAAAPGDAGPRGSTGHPVPVTRGRRRSRRGPVLLVLVLLLAVVAGVGGWWFGSGRYVTTPGVVNLPEARADARIEAAGLAFRVEGRAYSETVKEGSVVTTHPSGGEDVTRHGTVAAVLSRGPERHDVPDLQGLGSAAARTKLTGAHLSVGTTSTAWSEQVRKGTVLRTDPEQGTRLHRDAAVDLVLSKGPKPFDVPRLIGQDADRAGARLRTLGMTVQTSTRHSASVARGDVIAQTPHRGQAYRGDRVRLVVSSGPVMVRVPDVNHEGVDTAVATLRASGFDVKVEHAQVYFGLHIVVSQDPSGSELAPKGSTITLGEV